MPIRLTPKTVGVALEAEGYELAKPNSAIQIDGDSAYIAIRPESATLTGYVRASNGQPITGATISIAGIRTQTDATGYFKLALSGAAARQSSTLQVTASGYVTWHSQAIPGGNEISVLLDRVSD